MTHNNPLQSLPATIIADQISPTSTPLDDKSNSSTIQSISNKSTETKLSNEQTNSSFFDKISFSKIFPFSLSQFNQKNTFSTTNSKQSSTTSTHSSNISYSPSTQMLMSESTEKMQIFEPIEPEYDTKIEFLSQLDKYRTYIVSLNANRRLVYAKSMLSTCESAGLASTITYVIPTLKNLTRDEDSSVREVVAEELWKLCLFLIESCVNEKNDAKIKLSSVTSIVFNRILPLIIEMFSFDRCEQVRYNAIQSFIKLANFIVKQSNLFDEKERSRFAGDYFLTPILLLVHDYEDHVKRRRLVSISVLSMLAPLLEPSVCQLFLAKEFLLLFEDRSHEVRSVAVQNCYNIFKSVGYEYAVEHFLPVYLNLSKFDPEQSVRRSCAEVLPLISKLFVSETDSKINAKVIDQFLHLFSYWALEEESKWVRQQLFKVCGKFLCTLKSENISTELIEFYSSILCNEDDLNTSDDNNIAQSIDIVENFAKDFAGVVSTLGRDRQNELESTYEILKMNSNLRTKQILASSLHEMAEALGQDIAEQNLVHSLDMFLSETDEIRICAIENLAKFLSVLSIEQRRKYIKTLFDIQSESDHCQRFRLVLSQQLSELIEIYDIRSLNESIQNLVFNLCQDSFNCIRNEAVEHIGKLVCKHYNQLYQTKIQDRSNLDEQSAEQSLELLISRITNFSKHKNQQRRQLYVDMCRSVLSIDKRDFYVSKSIQSIPSAPYAHICSIEDLFISRFFLSLINLSYDKVLNVRLAFAKLYLDKLRYIDDLQKSKILESSISWLVNCNSSVDINHEIVELFQRDKQKNEKQCKRIGKNIGAKPKTKDSE